MIKLIIAGSRTITNYDLVASYLNFYVLPQRGKIECIITGMAHGVDNHAFMWATEKGIKVIEMPADWKANPRSAGFIRNSQMADKGTHLLAFVDLDSKTNGTRHMIKTATQKGLAVKVVEVKGGKIII